MRIKTTSEVLSVLEELKETLNFSTKAEVLKLAINMAIYKGDKKLEKLKEDGFEVDTLIIFDSEHDYYNYIIKEFYGVEEIEKIHYLNLINIGLFSLDVEIKKVKSNKEKFIYNLLNSLKGSNVLR